MRYTILGFNQEKLVEYGLNMNETLLLDYIYNAVASPTMEHDDAHNNGRYVWLNHSKIISDLPILNVGLDRMKHILKHLVDLQLISTVKHNMGKGKGSKAYYTITEKCEQLRYTSVENNTSNIDTSVKNNTSNENTGVKNNTSYNKLEKNIDKQLNKDNSKEVVEMYHSICVSLPKVRSVTDKRKKAIQAILKKGYTLEDLQDAFILAQQSDFLTGKNDRGWVATFDFFLREDKLIATLEGKYGGHKKSRDGLKGTTDSTERKAEMKRRIANGTLERI